MSSLQLCENLHWVGAMHGDLRVFDIIMESDYGTTYNAYLMDLGNEKWCLVETCKMGFEPQLLSRVESVLGHNPNAKIAYIIHNHTEPDHSGSLAVLLKHPRFSGAAIIASIPAIAYLKEITNTDFTETELIEVKQQARDPEAPWKPDLTLTLGNTTLAFHIAPFLHWPDSMFTYVVDGPAAGTFFTCDFLGAHYSPPGDAVEMMESVPQKSDGFYSDYLTAMKYYHDCIFGPFPTYTLDGVSIIRSYGDKVKRACVSHGPIVTGETLHHVVNKYEEWASVAAAMAEKSRSLEHVQVTIAYVSAYGYTKEIAQDMEHTMKSYDPRVTVKSFDLVETKLEDVIEAARASNIVCLGTPTINGDALPPIKQLADSLNTVVDAGLVTHCFGSYGWSGEGVPIIASRLRHMRIGPPCEPQRWKFRPTGQDKEKAKTIARALLAYVIRDEPIPAELEDQDQGVEKVPKLPAEMLRKIKKWKCQVCGEIVTTAGGPPVDPCPICGAEGEDVWIPILDGELAGETVKETAFDGTVVIVGGGPAGLNAAMNAKKYAPRSKVHLITMEECPPYNRTKLTEAISHPELLADFCTRLQLIPRERYRELGINLMTSTKVVSIDKQQHLVTAVDLRDGTEKTIGYTSLVLATGATPRIVPIPGLKEAMARSHAFTIRSASDIKAIHKRLAELEKKGITKPHVVMVGGGLLSLESIPHWMEADCRVTVVERCQRICAQLDPRLSSTLYDAIQTRASEIAGETVQIFTSAETKGITENNVIQLETPDGKEDVSFDLLVLSIGVVPNDELAKEASLRTADVRCGGGITTALEMHTSDPAIFAAGDVASCGGARPAGNWAAATNLGSLSGRAAVGATINPQKDHSSTLSFLLKLWDTEVWTSSVAGPCPFASGTPVGKQIMSSEGQGHASLIEMADGRPVSFSSVNNRTASGHESIGPKLVQALQKGDFRAIEDALFAMSQKKDE